MPTRSLHARGAVAPDDTSWCAGWVAITRFPQPAAGGLFRRPPPVAGMPTRSPCALRGRRAVAPRVILRMREVGELGLKQAFRLRRDSDSILRYG